MYRKGSRTCLQRLRCLLKNTMGSLREKLQIQQEWEGTFASWLAKQSSDWHTHTILLSLSCCFYFELLVRPAEKGNCRSHWSVQTLPFCLCLLRFFWQITWCKPLEEEGLYSFSLFRGWRGRVCGEDFATWWGTGSKVTPQSLFLVAWICQLGPMSRGSITYPNCNISWRPSVQTRVLLGTSHIQTKIP